MMRLMIGQQNHGKLQAHCLTAAGDRPHTLKYSSSSNQIRVNKKATVKRDAERDLS